MKRLHQLALVCVGAMSVLPANVVHASDSTLSPADWKVAWSSTTEGKLGAVSCSSAHLCLAVGPTEYTGSPQRGDAVLMRSTDGGRNWTRLRRLAEVGLNDIDCLTDTDCIAAGQKGTNRSSKILLYTTDGGLHWTQSETPTGAGVFPVGGLACPVNGECFAIAASTMYSGAWVLRSNDLGKTWKITTSVSDDLTAISCLTATACVAIGYPPPTGTSGLSFPARGYFTTDGWQSAHRSQFKVPSTNLTRVSCAGRSFCLTVALNQPSKSLLITRDGGRTWISAGFPNPAKAGLFSVDCIDATHCVVDGSRKANTGWEGIAMTNDGAKTWTYPHVGGPARNALGRIACWSTHACVALASSGGTEILRLVQSSVSG